MMRTRPAAQGHTDQVGNALRRSGAGLPVDEVVRASWNRCINTYSLDPQETRRPTMVERADLQARRERLGVVLAIARIEMEGLGKLMEHSEYSIMLTDRDGVILSYVGDPVGDCAVEHPLALIHAAAEVDLIDERLGDWVSVVVPVGELKDHVFIGHEIEPEQPATGGARTLDGGPLERVPVRRELGGDPVCDRRLMRAGRHFDPRSVAG